MRTSSRAARARIIGAVFSIIAHQIRVFCLPVSFEPLRDFFTIGFTPFRYIPPRLLQSGVRGGGPRRATTEPTGSMNDHRSYPQCRGVRVGTSGVAPIGGRGCGHESHLFFESLLLLMTVEPVGDETSICPVWWLHMALSGC